MDNTYPSIERTFIMIKPDGVERGLVGRIFKRFEEVGMKLVAARMVKATLDQAKKHYPYRKDWFIEIGRKSSKAYKGDKALMRKAYGTSDLIEIGKIVHEHLVSYLTASPVIISVWEGNHAIERARKFIGYGVPTYADVGTLREMYAFDTQPLAINSGRIVFRNLLHASDSPEEVQREIKIWFGKKFKDLGSYERIDYIDMI